MILVVKHYLLLLLSLLLSYTSLLVYAQTIKYGYTGIQQTFTVPSGVTAINIELAGAGSGDCGVFIGGKGAIVKATNMVVSPGQILYIFVGGTSPSNTNGRFAGYNGGGLASDIGGSGGGGGTDGKLKQFVLNLARYSPG